MDIPTRIGLGGTALFTLAGLVGPIVGWWLSGSIMAGCALVAVWGFWPLAQKSSHIQAWPIGHVPLHVAARMVYEAAEKANHPVIKNSSISPESKLNYFKVSFMVDDETEIFGVKPPSTKSRPIRKADRRGLWPVLGEVSQLEDLGHPEYVDVTVRRKDLRRIINDVIAQAKFISNAMKTP
jgi:hypothetical protein